MTLTKITLVGANGKLGPAILTALLAAQTFNITVLTRKSSKSSYPPSVHIAHVSDDPSVSELTSVLKDQDALVVVFAGSNDDLQIRYADAAAAAGVKRFIPADFGSCDSSSPRALELIPLYRAKQKVRLHLQQLASRGRLSWTSLVCGHFFDWGLTTGFLQYDLGAKKALIFDGGTIEFSTSTTERIALATVRILQREEVTRDRMLYVQSLCITQDDVLNSLRRVLGGEWQVEHASSGEYIRNLQAKLEKNPNDADEWENMVSVLGIVDANWEGKDNFANTLLGLQNEDIDELVKQSITGQSYDESGGNSR